jgi:phospholipase C
MKRMLRGAAALTAIAALSQPTLATSLPLVTTQPDPPADVAPYFVADTDPRWTGPEWSADDIAELKQKIKYVFVIFNENRSFDHEYGTLPGVNGLYSDGKNPRAPADTPGFTQSYLDTNGGETVTVQPFRVGPEQNSTIKDSTDHSHIGLAAKLDVQNGVPKMDKFAEVEWRKYALAGAPRAKRWASNSRASSWRISTATRSRSSGATPAVSPSSTTISPPKTRRQRQTRSR